jgi:uncharacterized membrane protein
MNYFKSTLAERLTKVIGSWKFIIAQSIILILYVLFNRLDAEAFTVLNLILSFQAAYTAPILLMSHNAMTERDRELAEVDRENTKKILWRISKLETKLIKEIEENAE